MCDRCFARPGDGTDENEAPVSLNQSDTANQTASNSKTCNCLWECVNETCLAVPPDKCSVCQGPVSRICQGLGEDARGWDNVGEEVLYCPRHHPNWNSSSASATETTEDELCKPRKNKGGRKKGSTNAKKLQDKTNLIKAKNFISLEYAAEKRKADSNNTKVQNGFLKSLTEKAITTYGLSSDFTMPMSTVRSRIKSGTLEVSHPGEITPVAGLEPILCAYVYSAWRIGRPLGVGEIHDLANSLLYNSELEAEIIQWKRKRGLWDDLNPDANVLGLRWLSGFKCRNKELFELKNPVKYERNRSDHVTYVAFDRQFNQVEEGLVESGNAVKFDTPKHMDRQGNEVDEANAHGHPVTIDIIHPENVFAADECGDNTNGKDDAKQGGEKRLVPVGNIPKCLVGISNSHFTICPLCNLLEKLVLVVVIFKGKKFQAIWGMGVDIFAKELEGDNVSVNFGTGKRYPGLTISIEGVKVPVY